MGHFALNIRPHAATYTISEFQFEPAHFNQYGVVYLGFDDINNTYLVKD